MCRLMRRSQAALDTTDAWVDSSESRTTAEVKERLTDLKDVSVGPILERYSKSGDADDRYDFEAHDEL